MPFPTRPLAAAALLTAAALTACSNDDTRLIDFITTPERVTIDNQEGLFPEGIDYSAEREAFVVSSVTTGDIGLVDDDGNYSVLVDDDRILSAVGVLVDDERGRVLVAMSDFGANPASTPATMMKVAMLGSFSLDDGEAEWVANLAALNQAGDTLNFANDIAIDEDGAAYVTNSFSPYLYRVTTGGQPSVFARDARLAAPPGGFGINGIVSTDDYLVVAHSANRQLLRIALDDADDISVVDVDGDIPEAPDGLELVGGNDELGVVCNASRTILKVTTDDAFENAEVEERFSATAGEFPTTAVERGNELFVIYAYLNELMMGDTDRARYPIERFDF